ncbi:MAG: YvcK family protein [Thermomicrobium sp.]|nr:YvcK family protein [Thermomicrobium sp.]MDW8059006.1 YvcK family protein [Thermomicrobium sp.]
MKLRTWLRPGMFVKRWIALLALGVVMTSLGLAMGLAWIYRNYDFPQQVSGLVRTVTLQFIPHPYREVLMITAGSVLTVIGFWQLSRSLLAPFLDHRADRRGLAEILHAHRFGPEEPEFRIVAIGGGTGLSTLLRGLKVHNVSLTAIVTMGDDGGSSGRLRQDFNVPPPGDIRNCLVALADAEPLMSELFQYRFPAVGSPLDGHSFGNLFIVAMTQITGSFERAVAESSRVLAVRGAVMPSTLEDITVCAEFEDGRIVRGESSIAQQRGRIRRIFLDPERPAAYEPALLAILSADVIVLGPGSLFTSVVPNLLVDGIAQAIRLSSALKVYVCNVTTQRGETDDFGVVEHLEALERHAGGPFVDCVLANENLAPTKSLEPIGVRGVRLDGLDRVRDRVRVFLGDLVNPEQPWRHDPTKLAQAIIDIARAMRRGSAARGASEREASAAVAVRQPIGAGRGE